MIEKQGDMFAEYLDPGVIYVLTTNGFVRNDGKAVMGRGTALVGATLHPEVPRILGDLLLAHGNYPYLLPFGFVTLPVKHRWDEKADPVLIEKSLYIFSDLLYLYGLQRKEIYLPRPGCGNGQLSWETVRPIVEEWERYFEGNVTVWSL